MKYSMSIILFTVLHFLVACNLDLQDDSTATNQNLNKPSVLVFLAHPDDEMAIAPVLHKYQNSHNVQLAFAFDGWEIDEDYWHVEGMEFGSTEEYTEARRNETRCACQTLNINAPIFIGFSTRFSAQKNEVKYFIESVSLKDSIKALVEEVDPSFIITFGPDGDTGNQDHRAISNMVTEVVLREQWAETYPVYYIAWTKYDKEKFEGVPGLYLNSIAQEYINVTITYSAEDEEKYFAALSCYPSQYDSLMVEDWIRREENDSMNQMNFRKLSVSATMDTDFAIDN